MSEKKEIRLQVIDPKEIFQALKRRRPKQAAEIEKAIADGRLEIAGAGQTTDLFVGGSWPTDLAGSQRVRCVQCGTYVAVAPSGQEFLRRYPAVPIHCYPCAMKKIQEQDDD